nr:hypothetical protein [Streptomyces sp. RPT161]
MHVQSPRPWFRSAAPDAPTNDGCRTDSSAEGHGGDDAEPAGGVGAGASAGVVHQRDKGTGEREGRTEFGDADAANDGTTDAHGRRQEHDASVAAHPRVGSEERHCRGHREQGNLNRQSGKQPTSATRRDTESGTCRSDTRRKPGDGQQRSGIG